MLGMIFLHHAQLGPKSELTQQFSSAGSGTAALLNDQCFDRIAHEMESKSLWDRFFPMQEVSLRIGKELTLLQNPLAPEAMRHLMTELAKPTAPSERLFSKHPANCFRLHALREIFPTAKLIVIHRDGRDVIASWGRKGNRWHRFGGFEAAIETFARKWNETVDHVELYRDQLGVEVVRYEDLVREPIPVLRRLFQFCEIDESPDFVHRIALRQELGLWKSRVPNEFHPLLENLTARNRERLGY